MHLKKEKVCSNPQLLYYLKEIKKQQNPLLTQLKPRVINMHHFEINPRVINMHHFEINPRVINMHHFEIIICN